MRGFKNGRWVQASRGRWGRAGALGTRWGAGDALGRWGSGQSGALDELVREGEPLPGGELEEIDEHE